ncbi:hypothetical protein BDF22DRAFT_71842 [Syncephalis plumigaleata]|nr:hypothetical protein BDF22DRAFT_71842 [Syncephalis plumigaleata]
MSFVSKDGSEYYLENACIAPVLTATATATASEQLRDTANVIKDKPSNDANSNSNTDIDKSILLTPLTSIKQEQQLFHECKQKQESDEVVAIPTTKPIVNQHQHQQRQDINEVKRTDAVKSTEQIKLSKLEGMKQILTQKRNQAQNTNTKIIDYALESEEMKRLWMVLKSLSSSIPMHELDKNFLEDLSLESMQKHMTTIHRLLNDLRIQQTERSAKENIQVHHQHRVLRQLKDKHEQLHNELSELQMKNNEASQMTKEMLSELKKYHHQTFHYTKLKNKEIKMLVERRDQLKVELAYRRWNLDHLTIPTDDHGMLDAQAMEDVIYGSPAPSIDTMIVEIDEEDEKYLLTTAKDDVKCDIIDGSTLQSTRDGHHHNNNESEHDGTSTANKSSKQKKIKLRSTSFIDDDDEDDDDGHAASTWIEQQLKTIMSGESGKLDLQKPPIQSNEAIIQKSMMTLKRMLNSN